MSKSNIRAIGFGGGMDKETVCISTECFIIENHVCLIVGRVHAIFRGATKCRGLNGLVGLGKGVW